MHGERERLGNSETGGRKDSISFFLFFVKLNGKPKALGS